MNANKKNTARPVMLCIMDGFGLAPAGPGSAVFSDCPGGVFQPFQFVSFQPGGDLFKDHGVIAVEQPNLVLCHQLREQAVQSNVRLEKRSMKVFEYKMTGISIRVLKKITVPIPPGSTPKSVSRRGR